MRAQNGAFYAALAGKLRLYIVDFITAFKIGHWSLWKGSSRTPVLCEGAMHWAIVFWHEEPALAHEVIHIVNDVGILHRPMWLDDGVFKEGVAMYSFMSAASSIALATLYARAFRESWPAIDVDKLEKGARWQLASVDAAGYTVDFGDSDATRGTHLITLFAAFSAEIVAPLDNPVTSIVDPCFVREWSASAYIGTVGWTTKPHISRLLQQAFGKCRGVQPSERGGVAIPVFGTSFTGVVFGVPFFFLADNTPPLPSTGERSVAVLACACNPKLGGRHCAVLTRPACCVRRHTSVWGRTFRALQHVRVYKVPAFERL